MGRKVSYSSLELQRVAYEVFGEGPLDLVVTTRSFSAFDTDWENPMARAVLPCGWARCRVILWILGVQEELNSARVGIGGGDGKRDGG